MSRPVGAVVVALLAAVSVGCGGGGPDAVPTEPEVVALTAAPLTGSPSRVAAPSTTPSPSPVPTSTAEAAAASASASPAPPEGPTAGDRARFVAAYEPEGASGLDHVSVDVDGDGRQELLFTYVAGGAARVDVAWWSDGAYAIGARGEGGAATLLSGLRVADVNGDDATEIVTFQRDDVGSSLSIWGVVGRDLLGLRASGGCDDGAFTYGVVGADLTDVDGDGVAEILATCDDSPLPVRAWSEETYRWDGTAYVAEPQPPRSPSPSPEASPTASDTPGPPSSSEPPRGRGR